MLCVLLVHFATVSCSSCDELIPTPVPDPISDQSSEPLVIFPTNQITVPIPHPVPVPDPRTITVLNLEELYVVQSRVELILRTFGDGSVNVLEAAGPKIIPGKFSGGGGAFQVKEFSYPYLYFITAATPGKVAIDFIPSGLTKENESKIVRQILTITTAPQPPPEPGPNPDPVPEPEPEPQPITPSKLQVVILEEPELRATLPAEQIAVMDGAEVRGYCKTHCVITNGTPDFRVFSVRQDVSAQPQWIKDAFAEPRASVPFIVILTPTKTIAGALPTTVAATMDLLKGYGGP